MATWAIGDVHGCFRTLEALVERIGLDPRRDRLWMVGDLVNRGPGSLEVLRWARTLDAEMGDRFQVVLGNHDLHLIARHLGAASKRSRDTLKKVLKAADAAELIDWLRRRPFVHFERIAGRDYVLVHAGLRPGWSREDVTRAARRLERKLRVRKRRACWVAGTTSRWRRSPALGCSTGKAGPKTTAVRSRKRPQGSVPGSTWRRGAVRIIRRSSVTGPPSVCICDPT